MEKKFSIFAQNLAYYNEGYLVGGWIDLPQSPEAIDKYLKEVVKIDNEHEEYEIADVDEVPFPYESIQWSDVKDLNNLAIIYNSLDDFEKESVAAYLEYAGEEHYGVNELINICLQTEYINYYEYSFNGIEYCDNCSTEVKMGYTMAEEYGIYDQLEKLGIIDYFDFEKYGKSFGYDYELFDKGYLVPNFDLDLQFYSKDEIKEKIDEIREKNLKDNESIEIEMEMNE